MNLISVIDGQPDDAQALISRGRTTTYGELRQQVASIGGCLSENGVMPGDRVAIVAANNWYGVVGILAALHIGAIAVPLNPRSPVPELEFQISHVGTRAVVAGPGPTRLLLGDGKAPAPIMIGATGSSDSAAGVAGFVTFDEALRAAPVDRIDRAAADVAALMYTSGTAGGPKAAMLTHDNLLTNLAQLEDGSTADLGPSDTVLAALPFCHIYGLNVILAYTLKCGGRLLLVENFDPTIAVASIADHEVTFLPGVPPMFRALLYLPDIDAGSLSSLRLVSSVASALDPDVFDAFKNRFGLTISEGYGLTEASPAVTTSGPDTAEPGAVGRPLPGVQLRLVDDDGDDALVGDPGELWVRGPNVFAGYWEDPEATAAVLDADGWLHTGDIAVVDDDGTLAIVGRSKELVIVSGFNVYPGEVEDVILDHPAVAEVAVVGVPHPHTGEAVVAHVVLAAGELADEDELIRHCEAALPRYKAPTKVRFADELPRTALGKVTRRLLG